MDTVSAVVSENQSYHGAPEFESPCMEIITESLRRVVDPGPETFVVEPLEIINGAPVDLPGRDPLRIDLAGCEIEEGESRVELNLHGRLDSGQGESGFSLYFFLWKENGVNPLPRASMAELDKDTVISLSSAADQIKEAVFSLALYRENQNGLRTSMGRGRGFLLFRNQPSVTETM